MIAAEHTSEGQPASAAGPHPPVKTVHYPVGSDRERPFRVSHHRASARGKAIASTDTMGGKLDRLGFKTVGNRVA